MYRPATHMDRIVVIIIVVLVMCSVQFFLSMEYMDHLASRERKELNQSQYQYMADVFNNSNHLKKPVNVSDVPVTTSTPVIEVPDISNEFDEDGWMPDEWSYMPHEPNQQTYMNQSKRNDSTSNIKTLSLNISANSSCADDSNYNMSDLLICNKYHLDSPYIVLSTTVPFRKDRMFIFKNTINLWSKFSRNILIPVLFIADVAQFQNERWFLEDACDKGWIILRSPQCNNNSLPLFKSMFILEQTIFPHAQWYGYANGDILFDDSLVSTLQFLQHSGQQIDIALGRRYTIKIPQGFEIKDHQQLAEFFFQQKVALGSGSEIDYMFTQNGRYDWTRFPAFVIGRIQFDSYFVHDAIHTRRNAIDITETVRAGHQHNAQQDLHTNTHESATFDLDYNTKMIMNENLPLRLDLCYSPCMLLKTTLVEAGRYTNQVHYMLDNMEQAHSDVTGRDQQLGSTFTHRLIPINSKLHHKAISAIYGFFEKSFFWKVNQDRLLNYPELGLLKPKQDYLYSVCSSVGEHVPKQLSYLKLIDTAPAHEWDMWYMQPHTKTL